MSTTTTTWDADTLGERLGIKDTEQRKRVYDATLGHVHRAFADAYRTVPVEVVDDCMVRVGQAVKDATRQTTAGGAQLTTDGQQAARAPRDPLTPIIPIIAAYVVPL